MKIRLLALTLLALVLTGCMGKMAVTQKLTTFNLQVVDNRYGRAGVYLLMSPVYVITSAVDLLVVNSIEFWTGQNPVTGARALVDTPKRSIININKSLPPDLRKQPL